MHKIALLVLYNHRYSQNISQIEKLYKNRFSHLYHVIPFYEGDKSNVLPVYESPYQFQSYIAQAYQQIKKANDEKYSHYFIVADDMIVNPDITEENLFEATGIDEKSCYITDFKDLRENMNIPLFHSIEKKGVEVNGILPSCKEAVEKIRTYGLLTMPYKKAFILRYIFYWSFFLNLKKALKGVYYLIWGRSKRRRGLYPILWGYSDILIIEESAMMKFCTYCGCFAACDVFVEQAIPTALLLSAEKITTGAQIKKKMIPQLSIEMKSDIEKRYDLNIKCLMDNFPSNLFFIHPIKLSQWK